MNKHKMCFVLFRFRTACSQSIIYKIKFSNKEKKLDKIQINRARSFNMTKCLVVLLCSLSERKAKHYIQWNEKKNSEQGDDNQNDNKQ